MRARGAPAALERSVLSFLDFDCTERDKFENTAKFLSELPVVLRRQVVLLELAPHLAGLKWCHLENEEHKQDFLIDLWGSFQQRNFCAGHRLCEPDELCHALFLITGFVAPLSSCALGLKLPLFELFALALTLWPTAQLHFILCF